MVKNLLKIGREHRKRGELGGCIPPFHAQLTTGVAGSAQGVPSGVAMSFTWWCEDLRRPPAQKM